MRITVLKCTTDYGTSEDTDFTIQTKPLSEEFKERYGRTARGIEPELFFQWSEGSLVVGDVSSVLACD